MMLCFRSACLMILYAMLCGLSAKSQYNPGTWVLNLTGLIIFCSFNPSSLSSLFTFFFLCVQQGHVTSVLKGKYQQMLCFSDDASKQAASGIFKFTHWLQKHSKQSFFKAERENMRVSLSVYLYAYSHCICKCYQGHVLNPLSLCVLLWFLKE